MPLPLSLAPPLGYIIQGHYHRPRQTERSNVVRAMPPHEPRVANVLQQKQSHVSVRRMSQTSSNSLPSIPPWLSM